MFGSLSFFQLANCAFDQVFLVSVLIAGGYNSNTSELFLPSTGTSCTLPAFPESRYYHTLDKNILCGGYLTETRTSCIQLSPDDGTWKQLLTLDLERRAHLSWTPESGIGTYLMGGHIPPSNTFTNTTTLIKPDGTQEPGFSLKYDTAWVLGAEVFFFHDVTLCFMSAMPAPSLTPIQPQWSSQVVLPPRTRCPCTVSRDGRRTSPGLLTEDSIISAPATCPAGGG